MAAELTWISTVAAEEVGEKDSVTNSSSKGRRKREREVVRESEIERERVRE